MITSDEFGEITRMGGFEVPELSMEPEPRNWYSVILGAGIYAVSAFSEDYALLKAEIRAQELRSRRNAIETNGGLPLVMPMIESDSIYYSKVRHDSSPDAELISVRESHQSNGDSTSMRRKRFDHNQGRLFDPYAL